MGKIQKSQLAIGSYHYACNSLDYFLESMKRIGVTNIELSGNRNHFIVEEQTEESARRIGQKIRDMGMKLICFCPEQNTFPYNICAKEEITRARSLEYIKKAIAMTRYLGCDQMLLCPGTGYLEESFEAVWKRCKESLKELVKTAETYQVYLMLETQGLEESVIMNSADQQRKMLDEVNHPYLKAMLDTVQMAMFDPGVAKDLELLGAEIRHVHLGNTKLVKPEWKDETLKERMTPGMQSYGHIGIMEGELPLEEYIKELGECDYQGYITIEICSADYFLEAERHAKEGFQRICQYIE